MKGRNGPTAFLPLSPKTLQQELEYVRQLNEIDDTNGDTNPYKEMIVNNVEKIEPLLAQMEQWSILSSKLNYIQYDRHPKNFHNLDISTVNICKIHSEIREEKDRIEVSFSPAPDILKEEYLNIYEEIKSEIVNTTRFDENSDLSTTCLGKSDRSKIDKLKVEEYFPMSEQEYTLEKLLDRTECQLLLDTGASKSFMLKSFYMCCKLLHSLPKFASKKKTQRIQVGIGQFVSVLFVIPVIIDVHRHRNVDLVWGIKNIFELEGVINSWDLF